MAELQCDRLIPEVKGLKDQELTVGRHMILTCQGEIDPGFNIKQSQFKLEEQAKNSVAVLKADFVSPATIAVDMTFYSAGEFKFPDLILIDGKNELHLGAQNFKIETVLEKQADGKPQQPYGAILPASLVWPTLYSLILLGLILVTIGALIASLIRRATYVKLVARLKNYDSITAPDLQFYKSIRASEINDYPLGEIEKAFRLYVLRRFQVPTFEIKDSAVLSYIKKSHPWLKKERQEIKKILSDMQLLLAQEKKSTPESLIADKKLLIQKMYLFVDHAESLLQRTQS